MTHLAHCLTVLRHAVAPRRGLTVSQWADERTLRGTVEVRPKVSLRDTARF